MSTVDVDSRGRIYIPKEMRDELGEKFRVVKLESSIKLIPVDEDPVEGLKKATGGAKDVDTQDLNEEVDEEMMKEIEEEVK